MVPPNQNKLKNFPNNPPNVFSVRKTVKNYIRVFPPPPIIFGRSPSILLNLVRMSNITHFIFLQYQFKKLIYEIFDIRACSNTFSNSWFSSTLFCLIRVCSSINFCISTFNSPYKIFSILFTISYKISPNGGVIFDEEYGTYSWFFSILYSCASGPRIWKNELKDVSKSSGWASSDKICAWIMEQKSSLKKIFKNLEWWKTYDLIHCCIFRILDALL